MNKFFRVPFALSGTRTPVPDAADPSGFVSYIEGYGADYQRPKTDPLSKNIERDKMNEIFFDITTAVSELQAQGVPDFITTALNGGSPFSYAKNALVRWTDGEIYVSLVAANTALPTDATKWVKADLYQLRQDLAAGLDPAKGWNLVHGVPNDAFGGSETTLRTLLLNALGNGNPTLPSLYADSPVDTIFGREYIWSLKNWWEINRAGTYTECPVVFSGDSTTEGAFGGGPLLAETISFNWARESEVLGAPFMKPYNRGHSGEDSGDWVAPGGYLDQDIAAFPQCGVYVARWGINDGNFQASLGTPAAVARFETNMRDGLARLRAWRPVQTMTIVLMTPNSTDEVPYRNQAWHERINAVLRRAARDYQCVFVDTYQLWRDSTRNATGNWFDDVGGYSIHPDKYMNKFFARKLAEYLIEPFSNIAYVGTRNIPGGLYLLSASEAPSYFQHNISYHRSAASGWPVDGVVITLRHADNVFVQTNFGLGATGRFYQRKSIDINTWGPWNGRNIQSVANGWAIKSGFVGPVAYKDNSNVVRLIAALDGTAKTTNVAIVLPVGWRPLTTAIGSCTTQLGKHGAVSIDSSGNVTIVQGDMPNFTDVHVDMSFEAFN